MSKVIVDEIQTDTTDGNVRIIPNGSGKLEVKGAGGDDAMIRLNCSAQTHGVKIKSPNHIAGQSYTMILPDNDIQAGKFLRVKSVTGTPANEAVGQLEYADVAAGITVQEEGSALSTVATTLNFVGSSVTASGTGATKTITVAGGVTSDAQFNTVAGTNAGDAFDGTNAVNNTVVGYNAGTEINTGIDNVVVGYDAASSLTAGQYNVVLGSGALKNVANGWNNVAIGWQALYNLGGMSKNVAIGSKAGYSLSSNQGNTYIGWYAGYAHTGGNSVMIGYNAGKGCTTDEYNCIVGYDAASNATVTGGGNSILGSFSGLKLTSGQSNCIMGRSAAYEITTGSSNTSIGTFSGYSLTTGGNNTFIGYSAGYFGSPSGMVTTGSNVICLGDGNVTDLYCQDTSISSSDARDKTDITSFNIGLAWVEALRPVTYRWDRRIWYGEDDKSFGTPDGSKKRSRLHIGFLAQEALEVEKANGYGTSNEDSLIVHLNEDETAYGMKYERLVPILVNAIKELSTRVKTLEGG